MSSYAPAPSDGPVGGDPNEIGVFPLDEHNAKLLNLVAPRDYENPQADEGFVYDLVAIGAGAGGLVSSKQSARRGWRSALVERHLAGGDCLNVGCVPSKALIRCARAAQAVREAAGFHVKVAGAAEAEVDFPAIMERMRGIRARIAPADSYSGAAAVGVDVYQGSGRFTGPDTLEVLTPSGEVSRRLKFRRAVVATGGSPAVPPIPGLAEAGYVTNQSIFNLSERPDRMVVIGAGPIGLELAQAFALFGTQVTVLVRSDAIMPKEDRDAAAVVKAAMVSHGVTFVHGVAIERVEGGKGEPVVVHGTVGAKAESFPCDTLLVATGRKPNVHGLGLELAGVEFDAAAGVVVDDLMRTTNPAIFAVGDVASKYQFTHVSGTMAQMVVDNALFDGQRRVSELTIPWVTYTEPEVAHVGVYAHDFPDPDAALDTYTAKFEHNDRAICEGATEGFIKVHCRKDTDKILGATIVAPSAGEMISELTLAIQFDLGLGARGLGGVIHSYPTMADGVGGCAFGYKMKKWKKREKDGSIVGGEEAQEAKSSS